MFNYLLSEDTADVSLDFLKSTTLWIVVGCIIGAIIILFIVSKMFLKVGANEVAIVESGKKFKKEVKQENGKNLFVLVPFVEKVVSKVSLGNRIYDKDPLFLNDGDKLYKIAFNMTYKVIDAKTFHYSKNDFDNSLKNNVNQSLRALSDAKGIDMFVTKEFASKKGEVLSALNDTLNKYGIVVEDFIICAVEANAKID